MLRAVVVLSIFFSILIDSFSQSIYFEKYWGGSSNDFARSVRQLSNGNIYVFGYSSNGLNGGFDFALNKLDSVGNLQWTKYYGGSLDDNGLTMNTTSDGNFIVAGESYTSSVDLDILIYKIDTAGSVIWTKRWGTTSGNESVRSVIQTADGGYALCGFKTDALGLNDCYILRTNSVGDTLWTKMIGGVDNEYATGIRETANGRLIISADSKSFGAGGYDVELIVLNSATGNILGNYFYGDSLNNGTQGIAPSKDGNIFIYGETDIYQFSPFDFYLEKFDTLGNSIWKQVFGGVNADALFSLYEQPDKSILLAGYSNSYNTGPINLIIFKTDSLGNLLWIQNYGDVGIDIGYDIAPSFNNGYLICGQTFRGTDDFYLLHLDSAGLATNLSTLNSQTTYFSVYPNPSAGTIYLLNNNTQFKGVISYSLSTLLGQQVAAGIVVNNSISLQENILSGVYFLVLTSDNLIERKKLVLTR